MLWANFDRRHIAALLDAMLWAYPPDVDHARPASLIELVLATM